MATPAKPRQSGIPTPGRPSGIPTPGTRSRSTSSASQYAPINSNNDVEFMSRAFADAIKANDPAQHRAGRISSASSSTSLATPHSATFTSGRRSVAGGRPTSAASSSSTTAFAKSTAERTKTPSTNRPPSRQSDVFLRSASRAGRTFEVGDGVRIESLGFEGTLQYIGEIDGKAGLWAGVELSGGFAGKGKNDGSVGGKRYFTCPPNCGVFVATTKLSLPTTGLFDRPSSVASSRGGRTTPLTSGRITPSTSFSLSTWTTPSANGGRVTPGSLSSGRVTPGMTPGVRPPLKAANGANTKNSSLNGKITAGSRASKYVTMTAKQLSTRDVSASSPARNTLSSPTRTLSSPTRPNGSPFTTPKPTLGGRVPSTGTPTKMRGMNTPRPRVPSAVAMPPPASPGIYSRTISLNDSDTESAPPKSSATSLTELELHGLAIQEKIARLMSDNSRSNSPAQPSVSPPLTSNESDIALIAQLRAQISQLEAENQRLQTPSSQPDVEAHIESLTADNTRLSSRTSQLEAELLEKEKSVREKEDSIRALDQDRQAATVELEKQKLDTESRMKTLQSKLDDSIALTATLKEALAAKEGQEHENDALIKAKDAEVALLQSQLERAYSELEDERKELGAQVDELRMAGQETIALYEERLSAGDADRYELENRVSQLEAERQELLTNPKSAAQASSATEIDNESLREQVKHLQKRIATLEDNLEEARAALEREEVVGQERLRRVKEKEDALRRDMGEGRKELDKVMKMEAVAQRRVEELEEDMRELTNALEDARAEVETLREKNLDDDELSPKRTDQLEAEVERLRKIVAESKSSDVMTMEMLIQSQSDELVSLRRTLDEKSSELESLRKKLNREVTLTNGISTERIASPTSSKYDSGSSQRDEIKGLKHIVQELQKEVAVSEQQKKTIASENELLQSEVDQLRQEVKLLEENLDTSLTREEQDLTDNSGDASSSSIESLQKTMKEQKIRFEMEIDQLRKRVADAEMKCARVTHELNKEISELEALVESKIYREDELEQELERVKDKLARAQKKLSTSSTSSHKPGDLPNPRRQGSIASLASSESSSNSNILAPGLSAVAGNSVSEEEVCEICEKPGHDIFSCGLLKEEAQQKRSTPRKVVNGSGGGAAADLFCVDCESHGHVAKDCPHSLDVF
ncbi:CAP-Gly domain-containing protein [Pleurotus pulmonarius]